MNDIVLTTVTIDGKLFRAAAFYKEMKLCLLKIAKPGGTALRPGTICIAKAESVQKNIGSSFVRIGTDLYYLSGKSVKPGTEMPVVITKSAAGSKRACVKQEVSLTGRCCVVSEGASEITFSSKITPLQKETIRGWIPEMITNGFSVLLRTNAVSTPKADVLREVNGMCAKLSEILRKAETRTCFSVLYEPLPDGADLLMDIRREIPDRIVTDDNAVYLDLTQRAEAEPWLLGGFRKEQIEFYDDAGVPLAAVYNLNRDITRLLAKKVYLRSGAYLVIEKTEAFVSIDVNTGKCIRGTKPEETFRAVNLEAAKEVALQIMLRNLSGMILVDFINLTDAEHRTELLNVMKKELRADPLRAEAVDITKLGIMEIVRARKGEPLEETVR